MFQRFVFGAVLAGALVACGGSSSETPPPLQPDPMGFRYASAPISPIRVEQSDAGGAPLLAEDPMEEEVKPAPTPGRSTWGSSSAAPK